MRINYFRNGIVMLMMCCFAACSSNNDSDQSNENSSKESKVINLLPETRSIELSTEQKAFVKKNNEFSFNLYRAINEADNKKSNITAPISVIYLMSMLNDGAAGVTSQEILKVLGFGDNNKQTINEYCKTLMEQSTSADPAVVLQTANAIVAKKDLRIEETYINDMQTFYQAEVTSLDFSTPSTIDYLNNWGNEKTGGAIPKIIDELDPETVMALMNAVYFNAKWTEKFDKDDTKDETFIKEDGSKVSLPMMHRKARAIYGSNDLYSALCLPFGSGSVWQMYILLPNNGKTVNDVIHNLSDETWLRDADIDEWTIDIKIPRFSTRSDYQLNDIMKELGIASVFDSRMADLSGISKDNSLYVSKMSQKATIDITEEGAKAASVSIAEMALGSPSVPSKTADFHCDRPFVYLIRESGSGAIFFIGTFRGE